MRILINKLVLFGNHGLHKEERDKGQDFEISLKIKLFKEINNDTIDSTVDYSSIIAQITEIFNVKRYRLLETLAKDICTKILIDDKINKVWISIKKTAPPIDANLESVEVQYRLKND